MPGGAPVGNQNAANGRLWKAAIKRAIERRVTKDVRIKAIDELADKLIDQCYSGDLAALREFGDRIDGKPTQVIAGDEDNPITFREILIRAVDAARDRPTPQGE